MDQSHITWQLAAEVSAPNIRAQIRDYYWPCDDDICIRSDHYMVSQCMSQGISIIQEDKGRVASLIPGTVTVQPPAVAVRMRMRAGWRRSFQCLFQPGAFETVAGLEGGGTAGEMARYFNIRSSLLRQAMGRIYLELKHPGFASTAMVEAASTMVAIDLGRHLQKWRANQIASPCRNGGLSSWQLARIKDRILASDASGPPTIAELAGLCRLSSFHMMRGFKISTGMTVYKAIENHRLECAKEMLADGDLSIKEIAARLGFGSASSFAAAFRRQTSLSPREHRAHCSRNSTDPQEFDGLSSARKSARP
jgi:AraC family transcriptional regulator